MAINKAPATGLWAVVPAAGQGTRFGAELPKQYLKLNGKAVIEHSLDALLGCCEIRGVAVALKADDPIFAELACATNPIVRRITGGAERAESVELALASLSEAQDGDWILVHDAARPCLSQRDIQMLLAKGRAHPVGALLAAPVVDTMKRATDQTEVAETVDRQVLWRALTPQLFRYGALRDALKYCREQGLPVTDEASAMEHCGLQPLLVQGSHRNIKITYPDDLLIAEVFLAGANND
ncbi:2-C-methyl-D-erythritol 4-phosphate cytidylyltransferase [Zhongshania guokunii]|uniref:2-C-methyl-D-erythritol 4-phosphate cytidylyltransferase n=1 Tax=Zhongshania guokunii TaxID=641783 RepID=A0ABV3U182_9GAMM